MALDRSNQNWPDGVFDMDAIQVDSIAHENAMRDWHQINTDDDGTFVPYLQMPLVDRLWIQNRVTHYRHVIELEKKQ